MKKIKRLLCLGLCTLMLTASFAACANDTDSSSKEKEPEGKTSSVVDTNTDDKKGTDKKIVVGFAQLGQESGWRDAETNSIKEFAAENSDKFELKFSDAQGDQAKQIANIREYINMGVDVIGLAPAVESGWENIFQECKDNGIPVILIDRMADVDEDLYTTFIGSDFIEEGKNAAIELSALLPDGGEIVELEGSVNASAANDRKKGFDDEIKANHSKINIVASQSGDFTRSTGKEVMQALLKSHPDIKGVYAHNDDMALGAIEAIKEAGKKPGTDIVVVSIDGVKGIFEAMAAGEANVTVECNPLLGPQFFGACEDIVGGKTVEKWIKSDEDIFRQETAADDLPNRKY